MDLSLILKKTVSNESSSSDVGDTSAYFYRHKAITVPYLTLCLLEMVVGVIGNIFVIGAIATHKPLRTVANLFILNLAIADLCVTGFVNPFLAVAIFEGEAFFVDKPALCVLIASACLTCCYCSLLNISAISFNRYIHICRHWHYDSIFSFRNSVIMCIALWILSFIVESPNFYGWGGHGFDRSTQSCLWNRTADLSYSIFFATIGVVLQIITIVFCYTQIYVKVQNSKKRVGQQPSNKVVVVPVRKVEAPKANKGFFGTRERKKDSTKLARTLFIILMVFMISWTPYAAVVVSDVNDTFPFELHMMSVGLAHINSSLNSVLYGVTNKNFRSGYQKFLNVLTCGRFYGVNSPVKNNWTAKTTVVMEDQFTVSRADMQSSSDVNKTEEKTQVATISNTLSPPPVSRGSPVKVD